MCITTVSLEYVYNYSLTRLCVFPQSPFANQLDPHILDWIMAIEIVKIAIIQLVNTIEPPFSI